MSQTPWRPAEVDSGSLGALLRGQLQRALTDVSSEGFARQIQKSGRVLAIQPVIDKASVPMPSLHVDQWEAIPTQENVTTEEAHLFGEQPTSSGKVSVQGVLVRIPFDGEYQILKAIFERRPIGGRKVSVSVATVEFSIPRGKRNADEVRPEVHAVLRDLRDVWEESVRAIALHNSSLLGLIEKKAADTLEKAKATDRFFAELNIKRAP